MPAEAVPDRAAVLPTATPRVPPPVVPPPVVLPDPPPSVGSSGQARPIVHWSAPCTPAGIPVIDGYAVSAQNPSDGFSRKFPYTNTYVFDGCESMDAVRTDIPD